MATNYEKAVLQALVRINDRSEEARVYADLSLATICQVANGFVSPDATRLTKRGVGGVLTDLGLKCTLKMGAPLGRRFEVVWDQERITALCRHRGLPVPKVASAKTADALEFAKPKDANSKGTMSPQRRIAVVRVPRALAQMIRQVASGMWGFCVDCGQVVEVVTTAEDRLQYRLARAAARQQLAKGTFLRDALQRLRAALSDLRVEAAIGQSLAVHGLVAGDPKMAKRASMADLRQRMVAAARELFVAEQALGELLGQPVDLLREAVGEAEKATDMVEPKGKGN